MSNLLDNVEDCTALLPMDDLPRQKTRYDALVLDARLRQSLMTVRSLGSRGLRVAALSYADIPHVPSFSSRWCERAFICPADEGGEACFAYLKRLLEEIEVGVLITSSDGTIEWIRRHRGWLEKHLRIALPPESALSIVVSKERTQEVARRLGIKVPRSIKVEAVSQVEEAVREIAFPIVVKPVQSWVWNEQLDRGMYVKSHVVRSYEEACQAVTRLTKLGGATLFQELIPGRRESISYIYGQGQIYARCAQLHTRSVGGQSSLRTSIPVAPDIDEQAEALVREIGVEGCAEVEFRRDPSGQLYLMEINPRLWAATELAMRSGIDFPYLLYQWANNQSIEPVTSYRTGIRLRYLPGHLSATLIALRKKGWPEVPSPLRALLDFFLMFFIRTGYDYLDWHDPLPVWKAIGGFLKHILFRSSRSITRNFPKPNI